MTLKELKEEFSKRLEQIYETNETDSLFYWAISAVLQKTRLDFSLNPNELLSPAGSEALETILLRLGQQEPIQYILGEAEFYGLTFLVNPSVLIPRQETEELVDLIIRSERGNAIHKPITVLDIGTGSGCIAISLKREIPDADVYAVDISEKALEVASKNALINEVEISFKQFDILCKNTLIFDELDKEDLKFDCIVSNPPYVRQLEKEEMRANVLDFEPDLALFVDDERPLLFYERISDFAVNNLSKGGRLYFEINQYLGNEMVDLLKGKGFNDIELVTDLLGNHRIIKAQL